MLDSRQESWGPTPLRFELLGLEDFSRLIKEWWKNIRVEGWARFKLGWKLKVLKGKIKEWAKNSFGDVAKLKKNILEETQSLDKKEKMI